MSYSEIAGAYRVQYSAEQTVIFDSENEELESGFHQEVVTKTLKRLLKPVPEILGGRQCPSQTVRFPHPMNQ